MPTQSIDLSAVTDATFNGSAVDKVNLNGTEIWVASLTTFYMYWNDALGNPASGGPDNVGRYFLSNSASDTAHPMSDRFYTTAGYAGIADKDGIVYLGPTRRMDSANTTIGVGNSLLRDTYISTTVPFMRSPSSNHFYHYDTMAIAPTTYSSPEITPFAKVDFANGIQPLTAGGATSGSVSWVADVCLNTGPYGECLSMETQTLSTSFSITSTVLSIGGNPYWTLDPATGRLYQGANAFSFCGVLP